MDKPESVIRHIGREALVETVKALLWPSVSAGALAVIGFIQGVPLFYLFVGVALVFAAVATGIVRVDEWRTRTRVDDKLAFSTLRVGRMADGSPEMTLGFELRSIAAFPIQFRVEDFRAELQGNYPPHKKFKVDTFVIPPFGHGWFDGHQISLGEEVPKKKSVRGELEFRLAFGRPGRLDSKLYQKSGVAIHFDENGEPIHVQRYDLGADDKLQTFTA